MITDQDVKSGQWFADLLLLFAPKPEDTMATGTPEEMIDEAAKKAFWISAALSAVWGPAGLATILPEIISLARIQMNLVYKIAHCHHKTNVLNHTAILLIFANALGLTVGPLVLRKIGTRLVVKSLSWPVINMIARKIGLAIAVKISQRLAGRWVPILLAPVFGLFSKRMTRKIGREANHLFADAHLRLSLTDM
jgi:hypothetical protein